MRRTVWTWVLLALLASCSFPGAGGSGEPPDGALPGGGGGGGGGDGGMQRPGRRIQLTIAAGKVSEALTDFPVYVDVTHAELTARLISNQISFRRRVGSEVEILPYELQSFEQTPGRLRAFVLLPSVSDTASTVFELQYGDASVAVAPNPAEVWRNHYLAVFHLDSATAPIVNSRQNQPGTPTGLAANASVEGQLGRAIDFANNNAAVIQISNPILAGVSSTISAWVSQRNSTDKDALVVLGLSPPRQARLLYAEFNNNELAVGLSGDDWLNTMTSVKNAGWKLLHWTYSGAEVRSRLYRDGAEINRSPFSHGLLATTLGGAGYLGNARGVGFDNNAALNGSLDEVRISDVVRSAGWIAAEFANQSTPATFATAAAPQAIP